VKDGDGDGVADSADACPAESAKTANGCARPLVAIVIPGQKLANALTRGLSVSLALNQSVRGQLKLLLGAGTAKKLGIARTVSIGAAQVNKTAAGVYTVKVRFTKAAKAKLRKVMSVRLTLSGSLKGATTGVSSTVRRSVALMR
jgi:hypothetical protein